MATWRIPWHIYSNWSLSWPAEIEYVVHMGHYVPYMHAQSNVSTMYTILCGFLTAAFRGGLFDKEPRRVSRVSVHLSLEAVSCFTGTKTRRYPQSDPMNTVGIRRWNKQIQSMRGSTECSPPRCRPSEKGFDTKTAASRSGRRIIRDEMIAMTIANILRHHWTETAGFV